MAAIRANRNSRRAPAHAFRYEATARFITDLVDNGTLMAGARVPSLREITRQRGVSLSTALQAYRALEDRGILQARPQSGFYVARGAPILLETPAISSAFLLAHAAKLCSPTRNTGLFGAASLRA